MRWVVLFGVLAACGPSNADLYAELEIQDNGSSLFFSADFERGSVHGEELELGDARVTAAFRGQQLVLARQGAFFETTVAIDTPVAEGEVVGVAFERDGETLTSTVSAGPTLDLDLPVFVSRSHDAPLSLTPASEETDWLVEFSDCANGQGVIPGDVSTFAIPAGSFQSQDDAGTCIATLSFYRIRFGTLATGFEQGVIQYVRRLDLDIASTP